MSLFKPVCHVTNRCSIINACSLNILIIMVCFLNVLHAASVRPRLQQRKKLPVVHIFNMQLYGDPKVINNIVPFIIA